MRRNCMIWQQNSNRSALQPDHFCEVSSYRQVAWKALGANLNSEITFAAICYHVRRRRTDQNNSKKWRTTTHGTSGYRLRKGHMTVHQQRPGGVRG